MLSLSLVINCFEIVITTLVIISLKQMTEVVKTNPRNYYERVPGF